MAPAEHTVAAARAEMLAGAVPIDSVTVAIEAASGRTLAETVSAARAQPPFRSAAMDGYGIRAGDVGRCPLTVLGEAAAGRPYAGAPLAAGGAVRIFTGAPVPAGVDLIVPQERVRRSDETVWIEVAAHPRSNIREAGLDFSAGAVLARRGVRLNARDIALLAASGTASVRVRRRPCIALLATGDEVVQPGAAAGVHQIFDSVSFGLGAAIDDWGGEALRSGVRPDSEAAIAAAAADALRQADLLVVIGGASVGDYDVVRRSLGTLGLAVAVERVAVRPGKPTWFGRLREKPVLGLPGNPAAALVCAHLFLQPLLGALLGREAQASPVAALLDGEVAASGANECYLRAVAAPDADARLRVRPCDNQDTSLVSVFAAANALIRRPAGAAAATRGATVEVLWLERV
ncbi:MAG TPA: gephyrin-like molybdotransferase Glp [Steroidobacteraceae bacterium]|nr:gephyrin-like molybdotransferase Glp [Steroidobacteraceae bacterium]